MYGARCMFACCTVNVASSHVALSSQVDQQLALREIREQERKSRPGSALVVVADADIPE